MQRVKFCECDFWYEVCILVLQNVCLEFLHKDPNDGPNKDWIYELEY